MHNHYGKQYGDSSKTKSRSSNSTLRDKPEGMYVRLHSKGTCTPMFIAALFTIAKLWKQSR
jgi:hypothetical protein